MDDDDDDDENDDDYDDAGSMANTAVLPSSWLG